MRPAPRDPFSYRQIPNLPPFEQDRLLLIMDGECGLCSGAARRIAAWDAKDEVRIATAQSELGRALLSHFDLEPDDPLSWLMIDEEGRAYGSLDAMIRLGARLKPWLRVLGVLRVLPVGVQDWLYARVARNRYRIFGRADMCAMPSEALRRRLVL